MLGLLSRQVSREDTSTLVWKHKTKSSILKQIKYVSPLTVIPESQTIQDVIGLLTPSIFATKNEAKYFLIMIGEMIVNREKFGLIRDGSVRGWSVGSENEVGDTNNTPTRISNTIIISSHLKPIMQQIHNGAVTFLGVYNIGSNFKYKYHDHDYDITRILSTPHTTHSTPELLKSIGNRILDILCVSAHYAMRYDSGDSFIEQCNDDDLIERTFFLRNHTQTQIVNRFKSEYTQPNPDSAISHKDMTFIWKQFLEDYHLPNMIFAAVLDDHFNAVFNDGAAVEDGVLPMYGNTISTRVPDVAAFMHFIDENITTSVNETDTIDVDELVSMFRWWGKGEGDGNVGIVRHVPRIFSDTRAIQLLSHFAPHLNIVGNKIIEGIVCSIWCKTDDIDITLDTLKTMFNDKSEVDNISIYSVYQFHCELMRKRRILVSKRYFDTYVNRVMNDYIDDSGTIILVSKWRGLDVGLEEE
jgi:hypothetical protein